MRIISWFAIVCFPPKISYSVCLVSGYGELWTLVGRTTIALQPPLLVFFDLSSLPCVSKAASSASKTPQKTSAGGCYAVFASCLLSRQAKRRRQYFVYYQGVLCCIGERQAAKTCRSPICQSPLLTQPCVSL